MESTAVTSVAEYAQLRGSIVPRLWTRPLRELNRDTSYGFGVIDFAREVLRRPLDPWQEWAVIHGGELLPDGRPRFNTVLLLVSRQNGKTLLLVVLALYWLFIERQEMILGTSTKLDYARESWAKAVQWARAHPDLRADMPGRRAVRNANGEQTLIALDRRDPENPGQDTDNPDEWIDCRYKIAASNEEGGRSLSLDRLICDELRQHHTWEAWAASEGATTAKPFGQIWAMSNQGDSRAVVLKSLRTDALTFIETGKGDYRLGLMEWSAPGKHPDPTDLVALSQANPNLGYRIDPETLMLRGARAKLKGGEQLAKFYIEYMCVEVPLLDSAIDPVAWRDCLDIGTMDGLRNRVALVLDVSMDGDHASLVAAAVMDGKWIHDDNWNWSPAADDDPAAVERVRVEAVAAWDGPGCLAAVRRELPGWIARVKPRVFGWFPDGPAAAVGASLQPKKPPVNARKAAGRSPATAVTVRGQLIEEIRKDVVPCCMGLAEQVLAREIAQSNDPMINAHIGASQKLPVGDGWRFGRKPSDKKDGKPEPIDGSYATAGAVHLARTLPPPGPKPMLVVARANRSAATQKPPF